MTPDPFTAAWRRHETGQPEVGDAKLFADELLRAWRTHEQIRALVWPLGRGVDGTVHTPCDDPDCAHDGDQPGHARCLAARILAVLHQQADGEEAN
jgi:hypothetical protein